MRKYSSFFLVICCFVLLVGCASKKVVYESDQMVPDPGPGGLNFTVEEFSWQYDYLLNRIKVLGKVKNTTGEPVQGCLMTAVAYDQFNQPLGANSVFLYPTFLDIDQESDFELNFSGGEEVVNIYIRCRFERRF